MKARVQPDEQDDEQVAQHRGQVNAQEQGKEHTLLLWPDGEPQVFEPSYNVFNSGSKTTITFAPT